MKKITSLDDNDQKLESLSYDIQQYAESVRDSDEYSKDQIIKILKHIQKRSKSFQDFQNTLRINYPKIHQKFTKWRSNQKKKEQGNGYISKQQQLFYQADFKNANSMEQEEEDDQELEGGGGEDEEEEEENYESNDYEQNQTEQQGENEDEGSQYEGDGYSDIKQNNYQDQNFQNSQNYSQNGYCACEVCQVKQPEHEKQVQRLQDQIREQQQKLDTILMEQRFLTKMTQDKTQDFKIFELCFSNMFECINQKNQQLLQLKNSIQ